ncbi:TPA: hypothetical protein P0N90_004286 [Yersinia enterocolitica]|nr:hypothetical protein [Yersinia enterocolitica]HDL7792704.1 hypothetical protein [Yersinia enterocolitica]HDL8117418.1 hypothetical protein [Yersinia enterocolitica]HDL8138651.1 hypothetical protein [Yersinia enterocolitica]HDL8193067.1 hypothetical protein [Yersinia enterocolitica]
MFKFELNQMVNIAVSDEFGEVKGRAEYASTENQYYIHYKAADGRALNAWFNECDLEAVADDRHPGCAVYAGRELPAGAVVEE